VCTPHAITSSHDARRKRDNWNSFHNSSRVNKADITSNYLRYFDFITSPSEYVSEHNVMATKLDYQGISCFLWYIWKLRKQQLQSSLSFELATPVFQPTCILNSCLWVSIASMCLSCCSSNLLSSFVVGFGTSTSILTPFGAAFCWTISCDFSTRGFGNWNCTCKWASVSVVWCLVLQVHS